MSLLYIWAVRVQVPIVTAKLFEAGRLSREQYDIKNQATVDQIELDLRKFATELQVKYGSDVEIRA